MCQKNPAIELAMYVCNDFARAQVPKENQTQSSLISSVLPNNTLCDSLTALPPMILLPAHEGKGKAFDQYKKRQT